jgi:hypothetical protein
MIGLGSTLPYSSRGKAMKSHATTESRACARVIGPFLVIVTATAIARAESLRTLLADFQESPVWPWFSGVFVLLLGLVVVALHNQWRGAPAIMVSVLGWLTVLKGLLLMALPQDYLAFASSALDAIAWWRVAFVAMALIGLYLSFVGWAPARATSSSARAASVSGTNVSMSGTTSAPATKPKPTRSA